ncbi:isopenicillin N synthase family oxygenase [Kosakonia sp. S42]|uniref:isopenicillin N synthase family dioxygenase n=1 Tax=Kosakonia sp. S42 TaxID=2767458 RepID=UPI00190BB006|nr:isopenicillin N synthase family oxygenase [Kosakonia sp. S42]MBK0018747.1 isopenicillin N synthase family oxygenase [Kosakonia sp. S42]
MKSFTSIPHIDLLPMYEHGDTGERKVANEIRRIYSTVGFACLVNHQTDPELVGNAFEAARAFHTLPLAEKLKIRQNKFFRGYMLQNTSQFELTTLGKASRPNQSEAFIIANEVPADHPDYIAGQYLAGPNQWPEGMTQFRLSVLAYYEAMRSLSAKLAQMFSLAFGMPRNALDDIFTNPTIFMRLQYYPEQSTVDQDEQYGIAPHTDYGFLTLLAQDETGGLQLKNTDNEWIDAPPEPGTFILNSGDMVKWLTNGHFISTPHRVINRSGKKRFSIPFFYEPDCMHGFRRCHLFTRTKTPTLFRALNMPNI